MIQSGTEKEQYDAWDNEKLTVYVFYILPPKPDLWELSKKYVFMTLQNWTCLFLWSIRVISNFTSWFCEVCGWFQTLGLLHLPPKLYLWELSTKYVFMMLQNWTCLFLWSLRVILFYFQATDNSSSSNSSRRARAAHHEEENIAPMDAVTPSFF